MKFPDFSGTVSMKGDKDYEFARYQYATTSRPDESMSPAAIIYPRHPNADDDVRKAILFAADNNLAVAVRTGGHAYSGTSSTTGHNIQLDLSDAYRDWEYDQATGLLRVGVSYSLMEFNKNLHDAGLFMPTGQCYHVHVGGHAQTGGYGQLARAFGLFGDQIVSFEIFLADGTKRVVAADSPERSDQDLFFAVLGGGPGNYGIVTHITVRPFKNSDHQHARAFKQIIPYDQKLDRAVLVKLLDLVQEWDQAPGDYDFCFTLAAAEDEFLECQLGKASKDAFMIKHFGEKEHSSPFNVLLVYFQYSNLDNRPDTYDRKWCRKIEKILAAANQGGSWWGWVKRWFEQIILDLLETRDNSQVTPISESVTRLWTFQGVRELNYPFIKNGQVTDEVASTTWSEWAAKRIGLMTGRSDDGLMVFVQCQNFGGKDSAVVKNGKLKKTAYAWRNTTVGYEFDVFYNFARGAGKEVHTKASDWQKVNQAEGIGPMGKFSTTDHRWFWASHGNLNLHEMWPHYYSSAEDYARCLKVKGEVDPRGIFTPNTFAIGYDPQKAAKHLELSALQLDEELLSTLPKDRWVDDVRTDGHTERAKQRAKARSIDLDNLFR